MLEGRDWASETSDSMSSSDFTDAIEEEDEEEEEEVICSSLFCRCLLFCV